MKRYLLCVAALMLACAAWAEDVRVVFWNDVSCQTNASATITNAPTEPGDIAFRGWARDIYVDFSATVTATVEIVQEAGDLPERTMYSKALSADTFTGIGSAVVNSSGTAISGAHDAVPLAGGQLNVRIYNAGATNKTADVYLIYSR